MDKFIKKFHGYQLEYFLQPGKWMSDAELLQLKSDLVQINLNSGRAVNYGIFSKDISQHDIRDFFGRAALCVMRKGGEPRGFFYNLVLQERPRPVIHAGLVMIAKNDGVNLMGVSYIHLAHMQRRKYGDYFYTNISATPSIVGNFGDLVSDVWPYYSANLIKPPSKEYLGVLSLLYREYISRYFPDDGIEIDSKRFVMRSPSKQMGFEQDPRKLSRYYKFETNLFCTYWLDYSKGEDMIQVGKVDLKCIVRSGLYLCALILKEKIGMLFGRREPEATVHMLPIRGNQSQQPQESRAPIAEEANGVPKVA